MGDMPVVGDLVKPLRSDGTWRLGLVEQIAADGRCVVRSYVAPANSYEGTVATYVASELVVVPLSAAVASLVRARAEAASKAQFARQIETAVRAAEKGIVRCACGGSAGQHEERCLLAEAIKAR